jgi:uncharacterized protein (DUF1015 family)
MADVAPFKGVLYNQELIHNLDDVIAPPYDVISPQEQEAFYTKHPNNVIRLILGKPEPDDAGVSSIHHRAAAYFEQWMKDRILIQDSQAAFYLTTVDFSISGQNVTRYGIIGTVRLEPFEKGIVLPHERTFSKVKSERLQLMKACHANFSPIFGLYPDGNGVLGRLKKTAESRRPDLAMTDHKGLLHKLWRITDPQAQHHIVTSLKDQSIYIADGHHRYETALNYRSWAAQHVNHFHADHPANFVMMSLSSLKDPGMVIFPAHRLLKAVSSEDASAMLEKAAQYFSIREFGIGQDPDQAFAALEAAMTANASRNAIGVYIKNRSALRMLVLKEGVMEALFGQDLEAPLRDLDVSVLTRLLMVELLGFDQARLDDATKIGYATTVSDAVKAVRENAADMAFLLNPTRMEQVQRVAQQGLIMPRKSTYFYPKVGSGIVFNLLK